MKYDVALSFASEDRDYVKAVAEELRRLGINVFYDDFESVELWGKNLYDHLQDIYKNNAEYIVMFISEHYAKKTWTNHERKAAQASALGKSKEYILPARFDDSEVDGILSTVKYIDLKELSPEEFADLISQKINKRSIAPVQVEKPRNVSKNAETNSILLIDQSSRDFKGMIFVYEGIERNDYLEVTIINCNVEQAAFLDSLRKGYGVHLEITFNLSSLSAQLDSITQHIEKGKEVWRVKLLPKNDHNFPMEMGVQGLTKDQIAEKRAKRILLGEQEVFSSDNWNQRLNNAMLEVFVRGIDSKIKAETYIPSYLYRLSLKDPHFNKEEFLSAAKLFLVHSLILSNTVEYIFDLDLAFVAKNEMAVKFNGKRRKEYVNQEPAIISVEGTVNLLDEKFDKSEAQAGT